MSFMDKRGDSSQGLCEYPSTRAPVPPGSVLRLRDSETSAVSTAVVTKVIGEGASCLAYAGTVGGEAVTIKEYYPLDLAEDGTLSRSGCELKLTGRPRAQGFADSYLDRFEGSYRRWVEYQKAAPQFSLWPRLMSLGDTAYLMTRMGGNSSLADSCTGIFNHRPEDAMRQVLEVGVSLLNRLCPMHEKGWLYVDVKPENVLLFSDTLTRGESRSVALFDFDSAAEVNAIRSGQSQLYFTRRWAAPELIRLQPGALGARTDIYGVGMVLLWMLVGDDAASMEAPFHAPALEHRVGAALASRLGDWKCPCDVLQAVCKVLESSLRSDPEQRYQDVGVMRDGLVAALRLLGGVRPERAAMPEDASRLDKQASLVLGGLEGIRQHMDRRFDNLQVQIDSQAKHLEDKLYEQTAHLDSRLDEVLKERRPLLSSFADIEPGNYSTIYGKTKIVDRVDLFPDINQKITEHDRPVYLHAFGGIGKSTVAQAFCSEIADAKAFEYIFWIDVKDSGNDVRKDLMNCRDFRFRMMDDSDIDADYARFIEQSRDLQGNVLMVIDNVTRIEQLQSIESIANDLPWRILVTSRVAFSEKRFRERTIPLEELEDHYCEELFYDNYDELEATKESNRPLLLEVFRLLRHHTYLIILVARVGDAKYSIAELHAMLSEKGCFHEDLQREFIDDDSHYASLYQKIKILYDWDNITEEESAILRYFAMLPDRSLPEDVLAQWIKGGPLPDSNIKLANLLNRLADKGWLIREYLIAEKKTTYKCHNIIQMSLDDTVENDTRLDSLYKNMTDYFFVEDGMPYHELIPYFDCLDAVLTKTKKSTHLSLSLMLEYVRLLDRQCQSLELLMKYATQLRDEYQDVSDKNDEYAWAVGLCRAHACYADAFIEAAVVEKKFLQVNKLRKEVLDIAELYLGETDYWYVRFERQYACSKRRVPGKSLEHLADLERILDKVSTMYASCKLPKLKRQWLYMLMMTYSSLGLSYNRESSIARNNNNDHQLCIEYARRALGYRLKVMELTYEYYKDAPESMTSAFNDLGMSYLWLYEVDEQNADYLVKANKLLLESYNIRRQIFGENSISSALALTNLSKLLLLQGKADEALDKALLALGIRTNYHGDRMTRRYAELYYRIAKIYVHFWERGGDKKAIAEAKHHIELSMKNAIGVFGDDTEQLEYKKALILQQTIDEYVG